MDGRTEDTCTRANIKTFFEQIMMAEWTESKRKKKAKKLLCSSTRGKKAA